MKQIKSACAGFTLALVTLSVTVGCAVNQREKLPNELHEWAYTQARTTDIPATAHAELEDGRQGELISFGTTPWGENTQFDIRERYFAASGRPCFRGLLSFDEAAPAAVVVCRYTNERWVATRAVAEEINVVDHASAQDAEAQQ